MNIQLTDGQLIITWERTSATVHGEILDRLKRIRGAEFNKAAGCWSLPVAQADRLFLAFPQASYDYDAICAAVEARRRHIHNFASSLLAGGVRLEQRSDRVIATGENVSPLIQQLVDERAAELAEWLAEQQSAAAQPKRPHSRQQPAATPQAQREAELLVSSLRSAAANEQRRAAVRRAGGR